MEVKKSPKADLEGKKTIFLEIGFVIALGILLSAFNWKTNTKGLLLPKKSRLRRKSFLLLNK